MSAILLPFRGDSSVDWSGFDQHVERTFDAGLIPAVNMDTGYANLIDSTIRIEVLERTQRIAAGRPFVAGAFVADRPGDDFNLSAYRSAVEQIELHAGIPILFQSFGLSALDDAGVVKAYEMISEDCDRFFSSSWARCLLHLGRSIPWRFMSA